MLCSQSVSRYRTKHHSNAWPLGNSQRHAIGNTDLCQGLLGVDSTQVG